MSGIEYVDLTLKDALVLNGNAEPMELQKTLQQRLSALTTEQETFRAWCDRFDELYFTTTFTDWGADVWADDPSATTPGRSHISLNQFPVYVNIPAALQAYEPTENMLAFEDSEDARITAQAMERVREAWKAEERWQLKRQKASIIKGLYGRTASYVYFDREEKRMCAQVIQNPRNLWMGYRSDDFEELEWVANVTLMDPNEVVHQYGVTFTARDAGRTDTGATKVMPWVVSASDLVDEQPHPDLTFGQARVERWDYWYRAPSGERVMGKQTKMSTWNVVIVGNEVVRGPIEYDEYEGAMPYVPLFNDFIPGTPTGRSYLHDVEQLIREKMTRLTQGAQMIAKATSGDYWQLVGENPPSKITPAVRPRLNDVALPGAGNRIEAIVPFVAQFQLEQYLGRVDRETAVQTGVNDMLLGLAPTAVLNSSKAINALVANYEARIAMGRTMFYDWDRSTWDLGVKVWANKDDVVRKIVDAGGGVLDIIPPSLAPRDDFETAQRAINLMQNKAWSQSRAMDAVGVDDPEQEQNIIRGERTDATLWPADVQVMAQLMGVLQSMGLGAPQGVQQQVAGQAGSGTEALRQALGAGANTQSSQGAGEQLSAPPIAGAGPNEGGGPFAMAQPGGPAAGAQPPVMQGMLQNGVAKGRIMTQQTLGRR